MQIGKNQPSSIGFNAMTYSLAYDIQADREDYCMEGWPR